MYSDTDIERLCKPFSKEGIPVDMGMTERYFIWSERKRRRFMPIATFLLALVIVVIVRLFVIDIMYVPTPSMHPTIPVGTKLIYLRPTFQEFLVLINGWLRYALITGIVFAGSLGIAVGLRKRVVRIFYGAEIMGRRWGSAFLTFLLTLSFATGAYALPHVDKTDKESVEYGDIVIVEDANNWLGEGRNYLVKRVVALGGDEIAADENTMVRNGEIVDESYLPDGVPHSEVTFGRIVPAGHIFLMGDNRTNSADSRRFDGSKAFIPQEAILAKVLISF